MQETYQDCKQANADKSSQKLKINLKLKLYQSSSSF